MSRNIYDVSQLSFPKYSYKRKKEKKRELESNNNKHTINLPFLKAMKNLAENFR